MAYPFEACGALLGTGDGETVPWQVTRVLPTPNESDDPRQRSYRIAPAQLFAAEREAARSGEQVLGYFHSHPDAAARPSEADQRMAWPGYLYVICSVDQARAVEIAAFSVHDPGGLAHPIPITLIGRPPRPIPERPPCPSPS